MALNAASHNPTGEKTGPVSGQPPPVSEEAKGAVLEASNHDATGQSAPGRDGGEKNAEKKVKSEKELKKEREKAEKQAKFDAKKAKQKEAAAAKSKEGGAKEKKKKDKDEDELPPYKEETPKGQKKILRSLDDAYTKAYHPAVVESAWYDWWEKEVKRIFIQASRKIVLWVLTFPGLLSTRVYKRRRGKRCGCLHDCHPPTCKFYESVYDLL